MRRTTQQWDLNEEVDDGEGYYDEEEATGKDEASDEIEIEKRKGEKEEKKKCKRKKIEEIERTEIEGEEVEGREIEDGRKYEEVQLSRSTSTSSIGSKNGSSSSSSISGM